MQTNLKTTVHSSNSDLMDSTHDISGISHREFMHLIESLQQGYINAQVLYNLSDEEVLDVLERAAEYSDSQQLPPIGSHPSIPDFRAYQEERIEVLGNLLDVLSEPSQYPEV